MCIELNFAAENIRRLARSKIASTNWPTFNSDRLVFGHMIITCLAAQVNVRLTIPFSEGIFYGNSDYLPIHIRIINQTRMRTDEVRKPFLMRRFTKPPATNTHPRVY